MNKSAIYTQSTYTAHILRLRRLSPGWRRPIECLKLQVFFRKRPKNYMGLLRKMTCKDKASCEIRHPVGLPPSCISIYIYIYIYIYIHMHIYTYRFQHTPVLRASSYCFILGHTAYRYTPRILYVCDCPAMSTYCIYVCMCVRIYVYTFIHAYIHICICIHTYIHAYMQTCMHTYIHIHEDICMHK